MVWKKYKVKLKLFKSNFKLELLTLKLKLFKSNFKLELLTLNKSYLRVRLKWNRNE